MKKILITLSLLTAALAGCLSSELPDKPVKPATVQPVEVPSYFVRDGAPIKREVIGNPLRYAAKRIDFDIDNFEFPRANEAGYRLACRFPIIEYVSNRPLYMKQWAEDTTELINTQHRENGLKAILYGLGILRGTNNYPPVNLTYDKAALLKMEEQLAQSNFTEKYRQIVLKLYENYLLACKLTAEGRKNLTEEGLNFFFANPGYYIAPDGKKMPDVTGNTDSHFQFIERARQVHYEYIFLAAKILAEAVSDYANITKSFKPEDFFIDSAKARETFKFDTSNGPIIIAGTGSDTHTEDSPFLIDLGGDDIYTNNAGGSYYTKKGIALCIDHSGNDYYNGSGKNYAQGFGFLGVGYLADLAGNDKYYAKHFCQGAGIIGVGAIWDTGGDDVYDANAFCQGAGMFGLGVLLDTAGEDLYDCSILGQGAATTLGLGLLSDLEGNDRYQLGLNPSKDHLNTQIAGRDIVGGYGQGGALSFRTWPPVKKLTPYGGVGILADYQGNDRYKTNGWCDQGSSYMLSLGVLVDFHGDDYYSNRQGGSSAIHLTNAILIDKKGNDIYEGGWACFGASGDCSNAIFIDYEGNDTYGTKDVTASYGAARKSSTLALFIDYKGQDKYLCKEKSDNAAEYNCFGGVLATLGGSWPSAICLDLDGNDNYIVKQRENDSERFNFGHGIHLDTEWKDGDVIGKIQNPLEPYRDIPLTQSPYYDDIKLLQNPDVFVRFQAVGRISRSDVAALPHLVGAIRDSSHRQFNRDVMECIHYYLTNNKVTEKEAVYLLPLLKAPDEEVRITMAHNLGLWGFKNCEDALIETLKTDQSGQVRRFSISALLNLKSLKAMPLVQKLALTDSDEDVRRLSVTFLGIIDKANSIEVILNALDTDPSPAVQIAAAEAFTNFRDDRALEPLRKATKSEDFYLKRAAAKGLATLYQIDAIEILIDSLSFYSLDTVDNYGNNLINYIAAYAGFDFPEAERYDQARWKEWYRQNKDKIDIKENVDSYMDFLKLSSSIQNVSVEMQIQQYEEFLAKHPNHKSAKGTLGNLLNQVAWDMVMADKNTPAYNPEKGLSYALRAVELHPIPMIIDTLVEAYYANGKIDLAIELCREELKKNPDEKMFKDRLEKYLKEKSQ